MRNVPVDIAACSCPTSLPRWASIPVDRLRDRRAPPQPRRCPPLEVSPCSTRNPAGRRSSSRSAFAAVDRPRGRTGRPGRVPPGSGAPSHWETTNEYGTSSGVVFTAESIGFKPARRPESNPAAKAA